VSGSAEGGCWTAEGPGARDEAGPAARAEGRCPPVGALRVRARWRANAAAIKQAKQIEDSFILRPRRFVIAHPFCPTWVRLPRELRRGDAAREVGAFTETVASDIPRWPRARAGECFRVPGAGGGGGGGHAGRVVEARARCLRLRWWQRRRQAPGASVPCARRGGGEVSALCGQCCERRLRAREGRLAQYLAVTAVSVSEGSGATEGHQEHT